MTKIGSPGNPEIPQFQEKIPKTGNSNNHKYTVKQETSDELIKTTLERPYKTRKELSPEIKQKIKEAPGKPEITIKQTKDGIVVKNVGAEFVEKAAHLMKAMDTKNAGEVNQIMQGETKETVLVLIGMCLKSSKASDMTFLYDLQFNLNKNFPGVESSLLNKALKEAVELEVKRFDIMSDYETEKAKLTQDLNNIQESASRQIAKTEPVVIKNIGAEFVDKAVHLMKAMDTKNAGEISQIMQGETKETVLVLIGMCLKSSKASDMTFLYDLQFNLNKNFPGVESSLLNKALKEAIELEGKRFDIMSDYEAEKAKITEELSNIKEIPVKPLSGSIEEKAHRLIKATEKQNSDEIHEIMKGETEETILGLVDACLQLPEAKELSFLYTLRYTLYENFPDIDPISLKQAITTSEHQT